MPGSLSLVRTIPLTTIYGSQRIASPKLVLENVGFCHGLIGDLPKVRVNSLDLRARRRDRKDKGVQGRIKRHERSRHLIGVLADMSQVHTSRSDVAHRQGQAPGELALDIQIPLHPVIATGIEFNVYPTERAGSEQLEDLVRKAGGRRRVQLPRLKERRRPRNPGLEQKRQGDDIEHPESAPDSGPTILERIPREADARREVFERRVAVVGCADSCCGVGKITKICQLPIEYTDRWQAGGRRGAELR